MGTFFKQVRYQLAICLSIIWSTGVRALAMTGTIRNKQS
jgi:hypothetical protein